ncbi:RNA polymerase sigma-70 factor, ECF subfamily [Streptomyces aidingensis]|uniref:RNA polymerase sigma-70 factor, ECF subfamily n=2 Tax=Streptomyces aidingensis TaxID=910347 RepID=A0A1I1V8X3_9ACTN|nr:RNA polymerase sigma-70 factor, ECF subfamily [Streptomyces aidingensis]
MGAASVEAMHGAESTAGPAADTAAGTAHEGAAALLAAARGGDERAFAALVGRHRRALHLHCYRMLGSFDEAEEALQDTMVRAWRSLHTYAERAPLDHWLHRIATTTCLRAAERRRRAPVSVAEVEQLQPYPDVLLGELDPAVVVEQREAVALAYVAALQLLPATQRAVVILREVLAWSAAEVAGYLGSSVAAVNSSLQRGRATLAARVRRRPERPLSAYERELVRRFVRSWERCDTEALAELLRADAVLRMPPQPMEIHGPQAIAGFYATVPAGGRWDLIRLVETAANGQPALAAYLPDLAGRGGGGPLHAYGVMVLTVTEQGIAEITGFPDPALPARFGLPPIISAGYFRRDR